MTNVLVLKKIKCMQMMEVTCSHSTQHCVLILKTQFAASLPGVAWSNDP